MSDLTSAGIRTARAVAGCQDHLFYPDPACEACIITEAARRYADALERGIVIVPADCEVCEGEGKMAVHDEHGAWREDCPSCEGTGHEWGIPDTVLNATRERLFWVCWTPDWPEPEEWEMMIDSDDVASIVRAFLNALHKAMKEEG